MFRANLKTKDDKSNYIFYSGDSENVLKNILEQDQVQTMSIDIGVKNYYIFIIKLIYIFE